MTDFDLHEIGRLLEGQLPVVFANNGHSVRDGLLQMKVTGEGTPTITLEMVARVLDVYFRGRNLRVEYMPEHFPMMYLRSLTGASIAAGLSVTITKGLLVLILP